MRRQPGTSLSAVNRWRALTPPPSMRLEAIAAAALQGDAKAKDEKPRDEKEKDEKLKDEKAAATAALAQLLQRAASFVEVRTGERVALREHSPFATHGAYARQASSSEQRVARELRELGVRLGGKLAARFNAAASVRAQAEAATRLMHTATQAVAGTGALPELSPEVERAARSGEALLAELSAMLRGATQWDGYMAGKAAVDVREGSLRKTSSVSEMARGAVSLSSFLMWVSTVKAMRMHPLEAEAEAEGTSALVDSVFFVLQQALRRASHCCDAGIATSAAKHAAEMLQKHLLEQLKGQLKQSLSSKLAGAALASAQAMAKESAAFSGAVLAEKAGLAMTAASAMRQSGLLRTLNALHLCVEYTPRLWRQAEEDFARSLPAAAMEKVRHQLGLGASVLAGFEGAFEDGIHQLSATLQPKLRPRIEAFGAASFVLENDAGYNSAKAEACLGGLVAEMEAVLTSFKSALVDGAREALLQALLTASVERLEAILMQKKFDQLGALYLDSELRTLGKRVGEISSKQTRSRLARLSQMSALLNIEREGEAEELWSESTWQLSPAEAKAVLALRIDFRKEKIAALSLAEHT
ncbi:hypothetical protein AB1Y20_004465 [Prymnesium parvum]|uniref:Conserved oligomeric Golgi complex subunit 4 C-terminal domain-containing protein n=1 Tax=Prymnesium parvum TaxID=97485 RepID=A0AB34J0C3_PRYPA